MKNAIRRTSAAANGPFGLIVWLALCALAGQAQVTNSLPPRIGADHVAGQELALTGSAPPPGKPLTLWYRQPARRWTEASIIGNGRLGGMVWGGIEQERIDLNEDTLWSGEPYDNLNTQRPGVPSHHPCAAAPRGQELGGPGARRAEYEREVQRVLSSVGRLEDRLPFPG